MLKIRLRRMGSTHSPFYRVVVSDSRRTPKASVLEEVGHYNPISNPPEIRIDGERVDHWVGQGAQMSPTVKRLLRRQNAAQNGGAAPAAAPEADEAAAETAAEPEAAEVAEAVDEPAES